MSRAIHECPECGEIFKGRADKRFCSDQCRSQHNNRRNAQRTNLVRKVNHILMKNRRILEGLFEQEQQKVYRETLNVQGFDFRYMTHQLLTRKGKQYTFCYEYGYLQTSENSFFIVRDKSYQPEESAEDKEQVVEESRLEYAN